jgi:hypothetical protein
LTKDVVFHFNKKHLEDATIPAWAIKTQGKTFYVNHVECNMPWSTKETRDNPHTKGSIKIRNCVLRIDQNNCATISKPTTMERIRLKRSAATPIRLLLSYTTSQVFEERALQLGIEHGPLKRMVGDCGSVWHVTEIWQEQDLTALVLTFPAHGLRRLSENEIYYTQYDSEEPDIQLPSGYDDDPDLDQDDED